MTFLDRLNQNLDAFHLLEHDFYKMWSQGTLPLKTLQTYAKEYYAHVEAFPRYVSYVHANCSNMKDRQILLRNLIEEEQGDDNHPELWTRFAEGLGVNREDVKKPAQNKQTCALVDGYFDLVRSDYATGLGALYAYERQTPEVSTSKIAGLKDHYGIQDDRTLQFFTVHQEADEWHTEEVAGLIQKLDQDLQAKAACGAQKGAQLLWSFLDGMMEGNVIAC